jgi:hypothetical protein
VVDDFRISQSTVAPGGTTDDRTPTFTGTISAALADGETVRIYDGTALLGNATVDNIARTWYFMPTLPATAGTNYTISARVASQDGILGNPSPSAARTFRLDTSTSRSISTTSFINNIWTSDGPGPITLLSKFLGFADNGFGIYDSRNGLPSMYAVDIDFKSPTVLGYGAGAKAFGSLRAGVDVKLDVQLGTATLDLNDAIKWYWANDGNNIILNSAYDYGSSELMVRSPSLDLYMALRADLDLKVDFQYKQPNKTWKIKDGFEAKNSTPLFERTIEFPDPDLELSMEFAKGQISITVTPPDLDTDKNTQLTNGVKSSAESDLVSLKLDIDTILEENIKLPPPAKLILSEELSVNFGDFEAGVEAYILDAGISETAKLRQDITATVDLITGYLLMENGASIGYTVGNPITLPLSTYDANGDGQLGLNFNYTKKGTVANKTDFVFDTDAEIKILGGQIYAKIDLPLLKDPKIDYGFAAFEDDWKLLSFPINVYQNSWTVDNLGTGSSQLTIA